MKNKGKMSLVEKYRPRSFDSPYLVKTPPIQKLENRLNTERELPHLLFAGSPGTGKTTIAHILVRKLCNLKEDESLKGYCLDMNASDERRLDDVRNKIKTYAKTTGVFTSKRYIFLDEVDHLDWQAQPALRRIMEVYSENCMFILSCNYPNKIIEPLQSRCSIFRFTKPSVNDVLPIVKTIVKEENIQITDDAIEEILRQSNNDIRATINFIDGHSANLLIEKSDICIMDKSTEVIEFIINCKTILELKTYLTKTEFNAQQTITNMLKPINEKLQNHPKYNVIVEKLCDTDYRVGMSRTDGMLQLYGFCVWLFDILYNTTFANTCIPDTHITVEDKLDNIATERLHKTEIEVIEKEPGVYTGEYTPKEIGEHSITPKKKKKSIWDTI